MTFNSILKFRWVNLAGALTFSVYGFLINALPVGFLNAFIALVDLYYLYKIYSRKEIFEVLEIQSDNNYLHRFLDFHNKDIQTFFPGFDFKSRKYTHSYFILRNMAVAGIFLAKEENKNLHVYLDYVLGEYRDFKNGKFVYLHLSKPLRETGIQKVITESFSPKHAQYLLKTGFSLTNQGTYELNIAETNL
jgi:hypothetical protein